MRTQLTLLEQQHSKTQETLKEKEKEMEKLWAQLTTAQGSFEEEMKKLKGQVMELQGVNVKKVRIIFHYRYQFEYYHSGFTLKHSYQSYVNGIKNNKNLKCICDV